MPDKELSHKVASLVRWMQGQTRQAKARGGVFGVSGGVDSALVMALAKKAWDEQCMGLVMPCHSLPEDSEDALWLLDYFSCPHEVVDLTPTYDALETTLSCLGEPRQMALANLKPRLRSMTLYYQGALLNYLVVGSTNKAELYTGYFTKHGDSGVDMLPLANLTKRQVWEMSRYLGVPQRIVDKVPSAGLWRGQTDEDEMGLTYKDLDSYLSGGTVEGAVLDRIRALHKGSSHKRKMPPIPDLD